MRNPFLLLAATALVLSAIASPGVAVAADAKFDGHLLAALVSGGDDATSVIVTTHGDEASAVAAARILGMRVTWEYDIIDGFAGSATPRVLEALAARPDVERVWLDRPMTTLMDVSHRGIEADKAWSAGYRGAGVSVAVIDTGIDPLHSFFAGAVVSCVSTIGGIVSPECTDSDGHGTHVAGTVASRDAKYPGVAPAASLAVVRVLHAAGAGTSADIIAGMDWVRANKDRVSPAIRVATMSIGYVSPGCGDDSNPEARAANNLVSSGVTFTVAAGNSGHNKCTIDGASAASKVVTVGAVDDRGTVTQDDDVIASFSSGGPTKDGRLKPEIVFPGVGITSAYIGAGILVATLDGTSMATPHAAGTAALLLQKEPGLTPEQVKDRMTSTAVKNKHTGATPNSVYGYGLGNACHALKLSGCSTTTPPPDPIVAHVDRIDMSVSHGGGKTPPHTVSTSVRVVDAGGAAVSGATVSVRATSPEGTVYTGSASTDSTGAATVSVTQRGGGHGTWNACVTGIGGTNVQYDASANRETCESIVVT